MIPRVPPIFGHRIHRERIQHGWSQREVAAKCGISASTVCRAERGSDVPLSIAIQFAAVLGCSLDTLLAEPVCARCDGVPLPGFTCRDCGRTATETSNNPEGKR